MDNSGSCSTILGIDPGTNTGLAVVEFTEGSHPLVKWTGTRKVVPWDPPAAVEFLAMLRELFAQVDEVACERMVGYTVRQQEPAAVQALVSLCAGESEKALAWCHPKSVRKLVAGNGNANDKLVRKGVSAICGAEVKLREHELDAVAIALYARRPVEG